MKYFNNDSIKFEIWLVSGKLKTVSELLLEVDMPKQLKDSLKSLPVNFWLDKLRSPDSDWASNLILYDIYDRDPSLIAYVYKNRLKWLEIKNGQVADWKEKLTSRQ